MDHDTIDGAQLYERIPPEAVREFSEAYFAWYANRALQELDDRIKAVRADLAVNDAREEELRPTDIELEAIELLQARGVDDVELLDRLVGRGEDWLAETVQRLAYFEHAGLAPTSYPQWCEYALAGAYDWIDTAALSRADAAIVAIEQKQPAGDFAAAKPDVPAAVDSGEQPTVEEPDAEPVGASATPAAIVPDGPVWLVQPEEPAPSAAFPDADQPTNRVPAITREEATTTESSGALEPPPAGTATRSPWREEIAGSSLSHSLDLAGNPSQRAHEDDWLRRSQAIVARNASMPMPIMPREPAPPPRSGWRNLLRIFAGSGSRR